MDRPVIIRPRFSPGQRIIAVSDIHGNLPFFRALMEKIHLTSQDVLVLMGDMIEKGADSLALLRYLMDFSATPAFYPLCGNCDGLVLNFFETDLLDSTFYTSYLPQHPESAIRPRFRCSQEKQVGAGASASCIPYRSTKPQPYRRVRERMIRL